jgi:DNA-directed RNA polymerase specialized sigma24 family protein
MEHKIHLLTEIKQWENFVLLEQELGKKAAHFEKLLLSYPKDLLLEVFCKKDAESTCQIGASLAMRNKFLFTEQRGEDPLRTFDSALTNLMRQVIRQLGIERKEYLSTRKYRMHAIAENSRNLLEETCSKGYSISYITLLKKIIPDLERYIRHELERCSTEWPSQAITQSHASTLVNGIYRELYREFKEHPDEPDNIMLWSYTRAEKSLRQWAGPGGHHAHSPSETAAPTSEEDFEQAQKLRDPIDFPSLPVSGSIPGQFDPEAYNLPEILTDAGAPDNVLVNAVQRDDLPDLPMLLKEYPALQQSVFELFYLHRFRIDEIARIKNLSENEVYRLLRSVRSQLLALFPAPARSVQAK